MAYIFQPTYFIDIEICFLLTACRCVCFLYLLQISDRRNFSWFIKPFTFKVMICQTLYVSFCYSFSVFFLCIHYSVSLFLLFCGLLEPLQNSIFIYGVFESITLYVFLTCCFEYFQIFVYMTYQYFTTSRKVQKPHFHLDSFTFSTYKYYLEYQNVLPFLF